MFLLFDKSRRVLLKADPKTFPTLCNVFHIAHKMFQNATFSRWHRCCFLYDCLRQVLIKTDSNKDPTLFDLFYIEQKMFQNANFLNLALCDARFFPSRSSHRVGIRNRQTQNLTLCNPHKNPIRPLLQLLWCGIEGEVVSLSTSADRNLLEKGYKGAEGRKDMGRVNRRRAGVGMLASRRRRRVDGARAALTSRPPVRGPSKVPLRRLRLASMLTLVQLTN